MLVLSPERRQPPIFLVHHVLQTGKQIVTKRRRKLRHLLLGDVAPLLRLEIEYENLLGVVLGQADTIPRRPRHPNHEWERRVKHIHKLPRQVRYDREVPLKGAQQRDQALHDQGYVADFTLYENDLALQEQGRDQLYQFIRLQSLKKQIKRVVLQLKTERFHVSELEERDVTIGFLVSILLLVGSEVGARAKHALIGAVAGCIAGCCRSGVRLDDVNVSLDRRIEVEVLTEDSDVQLHVCSEVDSGQGQSRGLCISFLGTSRRWRATASRVPPISNLAILGTHNLVHHELVDEVREVVRGRLLILVQESVVGPLGLLESLDRYVIVLQDDFLEDLVQNLLLKTENWLAAGHADGFVDDKGSSFTQKYLFEVHTGQVLFVTHVIRGDEVEERTSA